MSKPIFLFLLKKLFTNSTKLYQSLLSFTSWSTKFYLTPPPPRFLVLDTHGACGSVGNCGGIRSWKRGYAWGVQ